MDFNFMVAMWGYSLEGNVLEAAAMHSEVPDRCSWDLTQKQRSQDFVIDEAKRTISHPPYWHYLPWIAVAITRGELPEP